jgi:hypothetical protein
VPRGPFRVRRNPEIGHLLAEHGGTCWWCAQPADSQEHKYKRTDLARILGEDSELVWGSKGLSLADIRSIRKDPRVRFQRNLCEKCNNARSQPFDRAYSRYSEYVDANMPTIWQMDGIPMREIFGDDWHAQSLNLARYFVKHFGCRMVDAGVPAPAGLGTFLDGAAALENAFLAFVKLRSIKNMGASFYHALTLMDTHVWLTPKKDRIVGFTTSNFIGYVGVRFEWHEEPWSQDSFFGHERPILNMFNTEDELMSPPTPMQRLWRSLDPQVSSMQHFDLGSSFQ